MPIKVTTNSTLSINALLARLRDGDRVFMTPHVGNQYLNVLLLAQLGVPMPLVDSNIGLRDWIFHPHKVIKGGSSRQIAFEHGLSSHNPCSVAIPGALDGLTVAEAHTRALQRAFPATDICTWTEYLRRDTDAAIIVATASAHFAPELWRRTVDNRGCPSEARPLKGGSAQLIAEGIAGLTSETGWVVPNVVNLVLDAVLGFRSHGQPVVYSLSGPQMVHYIKGDILRRQLSVVYDAARRSQLLRKLPPNIEYCVVPADDLRFATTQSRAQQLNAVFKQLERHHRTIAARSALMQAVPVELRDIAISQMNGWRAHARDDLEAAMIACSEIFYNVRQASFYTQYDLLGEGETIVPAEGVLDWPLDRVTETWRLLRKLHDKFMQPHLDKEALRQFRGRSGRDGR